MQIYFDKRCAVAELSLDRPIVTLVINNHYRNITKNLGDYMCLWKFLGDDSHWICTRSYIHRKKTLFSAVLLLRWLFSVFQWFEAMFRILHTYRILIYFHQPRENKRGTGRIVKDYRQKAYLYRWASGKRAIRANIFHFVHFSLWFSSNCPILQ